MLRPAVWFVVVLALLAALSFYYLQTESFANQARAVAEVQLSRYFGREVEIEGLSVDIVPLSVEATGVVIAAEEGGIDQEGPPEPFAEIARVHIDAQVGSLVRPGLTIQRVVAEQPIIRIGVDQAGRHDAPRLQRRRRPLGEARRFSVQLGSLEVVGGTLELDHRRLPLEVTAKNVIASANGADGPEGRGVRLTGQVRADDVSITLPRGRPYLGSVSLLGSYTRGRFDIGSARFEAPDIEAEVDGFLEWRDRKEVRFDVYASGQGRLLEKLGYGRDLVSGPFRFAGTYQRQDRDWSLVGGLSSRAINAFGRSLRGMSGRLIVDSDGARYRIEEAQYGGGSVSGSVRMGLGSGEAPVEIDLQLDRVRVSNLLADQKIPLAGLAGTTSGTFSYQFARRDAATGDGWADLAISRDESQVGMPVDGSAVFNIRGGTLESDAIRLLSDRQVILGSGFYEIPQRVGEFEFSVSTEEIDEVLDLLPIADADSAWQPSEGRGTVRAVLGIQASRVEVTTEFDLDDVRARGYSADRLQGRLDVNSTGITDLRLEMLQPEAGLIVTGAIEFADAARASGGHLLVEVDAEGWPLSDGNAWLPFDLPTEGPFSGGITIEGPLDALAGSARGSLAPAAAFGITAPRLDVDVEFDSERVRFNETEVHFGDGALRLVGHYDLLEDRIVVSGESDRLELAALGFLPAPVERISGTVLVEGKVGGSLAQPELSARVELVDAAVGDSQLGSDGSGELTLDWGPEEVRASAAIAGLLTLSGGGSASPESVDLAFRVDSEDLGGVLGVLVPQELPSFESTGRGLLTLQGELTEGRLPSANLVLESVTIEHQGRSLENLEPVALTLGADAVGVESFYLGVPDGQSEFFAAGEIGLGEQKAIALNIQSSLESTWFDPWLPSSIELTGGTFDVIGRVAGTIAAPVFDGVGELTEGKVITPWLGSFDDLGAVLLFYPGQAVLDRLDTRVAGGSLLAAGAINWQPESKGLDYRLQFTGDGLNFRYPEGWSLRGDAELIVASVPEGRQLTGAFHLDRALYSSDVPVGVDQMLRLLFEQRRVEVGGTDEWLSSTQLNLAVSADETLRVSNNLADLRGTADLVLRGSLARPVVFGTVELDPNGRLVYSGNEYELERGLLTFANPYRLEPVIDLVAQTDLREYDVTLSLSGTPDRLNVDFVSDPPLAQLEVMALLTGGARPDDPVFGRTAESRDEIDDNLGAEGFLYGQATSLIANRFNRLFGLDQFRISPLTGTTGNLSSARVTVGKRLSRDLFATYSYDPTGTDEQVFELEWNVSRSLILVLTQNGDGSYAVDTKWEKAF